MNVHFPAILMLIHGHGEICEICWSKVFEEAAFDELADAILPNLQALSCLWLQSIEDVWVYHAVSKYAEHTMTGWWFGTLFIFHNIWDVILPIDKLIFFIIFQDGYCTTNQMITGVNRPKPMGKLWKKSSRFESCQHSDAQVPIPQLPASATKTSDFTSSYVSSFLPLLYIIILYIKLLMVTVNFIKNPMTYSWNHHIKSHMKSQCSKQNSNVFSAGHRFLARVSGASLWRLERELGISAMGL